MLKSKIVRSLSVVSVVAVSVPAAFADYATDIAPSFNAALTGLQADAFSMFGDATPFIIGVATIGVLAALMVGMIRKMRA